MARVVPRTEIEQRASAGLQARTTFTVFTSDNLRRISNHILPHNENRIWQLYAKALVAKTPEDTNRAILELRTELDEQPFVERRLVEVQIINLACSDRAVRTTKAA